MTQMSEYYAHTARLRPFFVAVFFGAFTLLCIGRCAGGER